MAKRKKTPALPRQPQPDEDAAFQERLIGMMKGEVDPPNTYCKHIVEKIIQIEQEAANQHALRQQANEAVQQATTRLVELQGQAKAYREDVRKFDKEILTDDAGSVAK